MKKTSLVVFFTVAIGIALIVWDVLYVERSRRTAGESRGTVPGLVETASKDVAQVASHDVYATDAQFGSVAPTGLVSAEDKEFAALQATAEWQEMLKLDARIAEMRRRAFPNGDRPTEEEMSSYDRWRDERRRLFPPEVTDPVPLLMERTTEYDPPEHVSRVWNDIRDKSAAIVDECDRTNRYTSVEK